MNFAKFISQLWNKDLITDIAEKISRSWPKTISLDNGKIKFKGVIHGSVGYDYKIDYPEDAFHITESITYCNPEAMRPDWTGGDKAYVKYTLKPLQKGVFRIVELYTFREHLEEFHVHYYKVK